MTVGGAANMCILMLSVVFLLLAPIPAGATVGWEIGDQVLDFGLNVEPGESTVLVDKYEVGESFFVEVTWKLNPETCRLQYQPASLGESEEALLPVEDDGLFNGSPGHARFPNIDGLFVAAPSDQVCEINPSQDEFLVVARAPRAPNLSDPALSPAPIGAIVIAFRATTFFSPNVVTIKPGEKVVWIYADGAQEPHSVTSGGCRVNDCSGGGQQFNSGLGFNKPGERFEHVFSEPGTFPYHCDLHLGSMQGTVIVQDSP